MIAAVPVSTQPAVPDDRSSGDGSTTLDALILFYADLLEDYERLRIATTNRLHALTSDEWGKGVSRSIPEVAFLEHHLEQIAALEHGTDLALRRAMRAHPLGDWVRRTVGVGEKQAARLLAAIGDPGARANPSKLWAYCGLHVIAAPGSTKDPKSPNDAASGSGVAPRRRRGVPANWSTKAKTRCYLIAVSCIKHRHSPYRALYDEGRAKYADARGHQGEPLSLGHQHARAIRLVMKRILLDLWKEARALRGSGDTRVEVSA